MLAICLSTYPEVKGLNCKVILFLTFQGPAVVFSTAAAPLYIPTSSAQQLPFLCIPDSSCYSLSPCLLLNSTHPLKGVKWYLLVVLVYLSPPVILGIFSYVYALFVHLLWKNVYSVPLPIF